MTAFSHSLDPERTYSQIVVALATGKTIFSNS
jgi:hypothetical protein